MKDEMLPYTLNTTTQRQLQVLPVLTKLVPGTTGVAFVSIHRPACGINGIFDSTAPSMLSMYSSSALTIGLVHKRAVGSQPKYDMSLQTSGSKTIQE